MNNLSINLNKLGREKDQIKPKAGRKEEGERQILIKSKTEKTIEKTEN